MLRATLPLTMAALLTVAIVCAEPASSLFTNPGFESLDDAGKPVGWSLTGKGEIVTGAAAAHGGQRYARVRFEDCALQTVPCQPSAYYFVEGYVRAERAECTEVPRVKAYFQKADGASALISGGFIEQADYRSWQPFRIVLRAPEDATQMVLRLIGQYNGVEWFYFDDIRVVAVPVREWPTAETLPDLAGKTVTVPWIADVRSFAMYRVAPLSVAPVDGLLSTAAWTGRAREIKSRPPTCDFDLSFASPLAANWLLVHAVSPTDVLGEAKVFALPAPRAPERAVLAAVAPSAEMVHSVRLPGTSLPGLRLRLYGTDRRTASLQEIQAFGVRKGLLATAPPQHLAAAATEGAQALTAAEAAALRSACGQPADRQALVASAAAEPAAPATVELAAGRPLHLFAGGGAQATGVTGLTLLLPDLRRRPGAVLELAVKQPAELDLNLQFAEWSDRGLTDQVKTVSPRCYADLCRVPIALSARGPLAVSLDLPDLLLPPGERLWLTLRCNQDLGLPAGGVRLALATCRPETAAREYLPRLERLLRQVYSNATEAHVYDGGSYRGTNLHRLTQRVLALDAGNQPAQLIQRRIARRWWPVQVPRPGPADAPDWAVWGRHLAAQWKSVADWWLANRWVENGELGANLNDDVEYTCHWPLAYLITGDDRYRQAQRALADAIWEQSGGNGYAIAATDVEHAAEDSSCSLPQMLLCEYGRPEHVERMMKMSEHIPFWTGINERGRRQFRSYIFSTKMVDDKPPHDIDHLYCSLAMCGATHLAWYNGNPQVQSWVREYAQSWAAAALSTDKGKPRGALPCDLRYRDSALAPYTEKWNQSVYYSFGDYVTKSFLIGAQELVRDPALQEAVDLQTLAPAAAVQRVEADQARLAALPAPDPGQPEALDGTWRGPGDELSMYRAALTTGKRQVLVAGLQELAREFERTRWLVTAAEPITDRVPVPGTTLLRHMFLGGDCAGKTHVPQLGVSWEGGGTDFAALVVQNGYDGLKVLLYNFRDQPLPLGMRTWKLDHGRYQVSVGVDSNADDVAEKPQQRELELYRHALAPLLLPPRATTVVEVRQLAQLEPLGQRADLALGEDDVRQTGQRQLAVTAHNLGGAAAPASTVRLVDGKGVTQAEAALPPLEAPLDLRPRTATVQLASRQPPAAGWRVVVDPAGRIAEICEENNTLEVGRRRERFVYFGG